MKPARIVPWLLLVAGLAAYHNSFRVPFLFDDLPHIVENFRIRQLGRPGEILANTSRPVVHLSLALNYAISGLDVWSYHAFNLAVHILAALTLYGILKRTGAGKIAFAVALLWLVHPLQTQAVTYVIQRGESLMALFYLLTIYCFIRGWSIAAVVACALGMATKPVMATAPVAVLLVDRVFVAGSVREALRARWRLYAGLAATWLVLAVVLAAGSHEWRGTAGFEQQKLGVAEFARTQPAVLLHYLRLAVWPRPLCLDYGWPVATAARQWLPPAIVVAGLVAATVWAWRRKPALGFLGAFFFLVLAPSSSVIPIRDLAFEHRMYLPLAAVMTVVVLALSRLRGWPAIVACVAVLFGALTVQRNRDYRSPVVIWGDTVAKAPGNARARANLGNALLEAGRYAEAVPHLEQAVRLKPDFAQAWNNLGKALGMLGDTEKAKTHFAEALRLMPNYAEAHYNLGTALVEQRKLEEAVVHLREAVRLKPHDPDAHNNLGNALTQLGRLDEAAAHLAEAARQNPAFPEAHYNWGIALFHKGNLDEAAARFRHALRLRPQHAGAHYNLAVTLARQGHTAEAREHFRIAAQLDPNLRPPEMAQ
jgi:Flp pilus assembly protein TadD